MAAQDPYVVGGYWNVGYTVNDSSFNPVSELQSIAPSAIIELFELQLNTAIQGSNAIYRFHAGTNATGINGDIVWAGNTYQAFPIEADGFEYNGSGQLPRPKIRVSNIMGTITAIMLATPLEGAKVTRIRTMARYLDAVNFSGGVNPYGTPDPTAEFPREVYNIDRKSVETRDVVEFELAAAFDLVGVRAPKRQCISNICQWVYRSAECSYTAAGYYDENDNAVTTIGADVCGKRLNSCKVRFAPYSRTGTVTVGSNVWTTASTLNILPGELIRGWGLPVGTTVATVASSTTLTLSANATATTSVTKTGTASAIDASMTVNNTTGMAVGMAVSGTYMNSVTVTGIAGLTLTLSARPYSFSATGTYQHNNPPLVKDAILLSDTTGISAGMRVFGTFGIDTTVFSVITNTQIILTDKPASPGDGAAVTVYFMPASPAALSYTFSGNSTYNLRDPNVGLPFGSFPGVGTYFT